MDHKKRLMFPERGERVKAIVERVLFIDPGLGGTGWAFCTPSGVFALVEWIYASGPRWEIRSRRRIGCDSEEHLVDRGAFSMWVKMTSLGAALR